MKRSITRFHVDERDDWVAELDCYHNQHVRHKPPFINRPWVETSEGRDRMLGETLDCLRCDRFELPPGLVEYKHTPTFNENSVPKGLLKDHSTKPGVWGQIHVVTGSLQYNIDELSQTLTPAIPGIVVPCMLHSVQPVDQVSFYVAFFRREVSEDP